MKCENDSSNIPAILIFMRVPADSNRVRMHFENLEGFSLKKLFAHSGDSTDDCIAHATHTNLFSAKTMSHALCQLNIDFTFFVRLRNWISKSTLLTTFSQNSQNQYRNSAIDWAIESQFQFKLTAFGICHWYVCSCSYLCILRELQKATRNTWI